jgi:hypothetical protein
MKRFLLIAALLIAGVVCATWMCAGTGILEGFRGVLLRVLAGYCVLIGLSHFVFLLLPRIGIGPKICDLDDTSETRRAGNHR